MSEDQLPPDPVALKGGQFLHDRNTQFHASTEVEDVANYLRASGDKIPNEPAHKINAYLGFLASEGTVNDGILTGDTESIQRQIESRVIKAEEVPEAYFDLQRRIARERGHGDVELTDRERAMQVEAVKADQRASLNKWVEYFGENDQYPKWFKHYVWNSVTKLGAFVKKHDDAGRVINGEFLTRSRGTTTPYPELNREALAYVYDVLDKSRIQGEKVDGGKNDEKLQKLLQGANFGKLYAHAILEVTPASVELRKNTVGSWKKYDQTDDPDVAKRLSGSLQGHGTGWCTAGETMAHDQLRNGDFYVYYSRDAEGKDTVPRVAIRMEQGRVAEVRGISADQEMEPVMVDIATDKFRGLPGGEEYEAKAQDMKRLTELDKRIAANPDTELTRDDLRFLYEMDHEIKGFGYERDPRIDELHQRRGERDVPEIARMMPEFIREQFKGSLIGYQWINDRLAPMRQADYRESATDISAEEVQRQAVEALHRLDLGLPTKEHKGTVSPEALVRLFEQKSREWQEAGVYDYLAEQLVKKGTEHVLVITPNIQVDMRQLGSLAQSFSLRHNEYAMVDRDLYEEDAVTPQELSGSAGDGPVRFSLVAAEVGDLLNGPTVSEHRKVLHDLQEDRPGLHARTPSPLEAVSYWLAVEENPRYKDYMAFLTAIDHLDIHPEGDKVAILRTGVVSGRASIMVGHIEHLAYDPLENRVTRIESRSPTRFAVG